MQVTKTLSFYCRPNHLDEYWGWVWPGSVLNVIGTTTTGVDAVIDAADVGSRPES